MRVRKMNCVVADLTERTAAVETVEAGVFVSPAGLAERFSARLPEPIVCLCTGVLTGTGAPGSGVMSWGGRAVPAVYAEGRLGAYLRYAGIDALVLAGKSETPLALQIEDGAASLEEAARLDRPGLEEQFLLSAEDTVIAVPEAEGVVENGGFSIGDSRVAGQLREMGLAAIAVTGTGAVAIADSRKFLETVLELYRKAPKPVTPAWQRTDLPAVPYLSVAPEGKAFHPLEARVDLALGVNLDGITAPPERRAYLLRLLGACTGEPWEEAALEEWTAGREEAR